MRAGHIIGSVSISGDGGTARHPKSICFHAVAGDVIVQMIEIQAIPEDQIPVYLERAEVNIAACLRIAPTEQDYLAVKRGIGEYRKRHNK